jgi:transcriptional regulator with XRE-family HTH domain
MTDQETAKLKRAHQRAEGKLIEHAMKVKHLSARKAADLAGMSDSRWRQIVNGYASAGGGRVNPVRGPDETIARMARVTGVTPEQLREADRTDAADLLLTLSGMQAESDWQRTGDALDRLIRMRVEFDEIIAQMDGPVGEPGA